MPLNVLIVDDSKLVLDRLTSTLAEVEGLGAIEKASNQHSAIQAFQRSNTDVAILDIHLLEGNGIEVLAHVKKERPGTTVIILTNYTEDCYRKICFDKGANYFLDKSIEFEKVYDICRNLAKKN